MPDKDKKIDCVVGFPSRRAFGAMRWAALAAAIAFPILLSIRLFGNEDLGYHLAYGDEFLDTGKPVEHNSFLYTLPTDGESPAGPGGWYDDTGKFCFAMPSFLSQVIMSVVFRYFGSAGICILPVILFSLVVFFMVMIMFRLGVGPVLSAAGVMLVSLVSYERFNLRPEVFGYVFLLAQVFVLVWAIDPMGTRRRVISWKAVIALAILQGLFVNFHVSNVLGYGPTAAFMICAGAKILWRKSHPDGDTEADRVHRRNLSRLTIAIALQFAAAFANPWTWHLAVLPFQNLVQFWSHDIAGTVQAEGKHPLAEIGEFFSPFAVDFRGFWATYTYYVVLGISGMGIISSALKKRWGLLLILLGMTAVSYLLRRNIAIGSMVVVPVAAGCIWSVVRDMREKLSLALRRRICISASTVIIIFAVWMNVQVVRGEFYYSQNIPTRFGIGPDPWGWPTDVADWLTVNKPAGRMWTDFDLSSNIYYLTEPHPDIPILTNGWAYPPATLGMVFDVCLRRRAFGPIEEKYNLKLAALTVSSSSSPLLRYLDKRDDWTCVFLGLKHIVFLKKDGTNDLLVEKFKFDEDSFPLDAHIKYLRGIDKFDGFTFRHVGEMFHCLGWYTTAAEMFRLAIENGQDSGWMWNRRGTFLAKVGTRHLLAGQMKYNRKDPDGGYRDSQEGKKYLLEAKKCFNKAKKLNPDNTEVQNNLKLLENQITQLNRNIISVPMNFDYFPKEYQQGMKLKIPNP